MFPIICNGQARKDNAIAITIIVIVFLPPVIATESAGPPCITPINRSRRLLGKVSEESLTSYIYIYNSIYIQCLLYLERTRRKLTVTHRESGKIASR